MNKLVLGVVTLLASTAFANTNGYELKMDVSMNGKHISSPRVVTKSGEMATITQKNETEESFIEVITEEGELQGHKGILMKFTVGLIGANGKRTIVSRPQILALENEPAQISVGKKDGGAEQLSLSVVAKRRVL